MIPANSLCSQEQAHLIFSLPETVFGILKHLPPKDLRSASTVCQIWHNVTRDFDYLYQNALRQLFPGKLSFIDRHVWDRKSIQSISLKPSETYRPNYNRIVQILKAFTPLKIEGDAGKTVITFPAGLTLKMLHALLEKAMGKKVSLGHLGFNPVVDEAITEDYTFVIANAVLEGSRGKDPNKYPELFPAMDHTICKIPNLIEAFGLLALTCIVSQDGSFGPTYQLGMNPQTHAYFLARRVTETFYPIIVTGAIGELSEKRLNLAHYFAHDSDFGKGVGFMPVGK